MYSFITLLVLSYDKTLATCHLRANIICVETRLKFVLIPFEELALERCHVDSRSNCKRKVDSTNNNSENKMVVSSAKSIN